MPNFLLVKNRKIMDKSFVITIIKRTISLKIIDSQKSKKLAVVLAIFMSITASLEAVSL